MNAMKTLKLLSALSFLVQASAGSLQAAFESIGAGARPLAMGNAFTAVADDAHAVYYNPAGLPQVRRPEITAGYGKLFSGLKDSSNLGAGFIAAAQPLRQGSWGTAGMGWLSLNLQDAYREDSLLLSYGKETFAGLFLGGSAKLLKRSFGSDPYTRADPLFQRYGQNTTNYSFDFGLLYRPDPSYSFGFAVKDFNRPDVALAGGEKLPLEFRGGFGYHQRQLSFDAEISRKDKDTGVSMGLEKWLASVLALRAGINVGSRNKREIGTGIGYKGGYFGLDYSFTFPLAGVESTAGSHRFSLTVRFGKAPEKARWEFEEEGSREVNALLEQKSAQIDALEKELEELKELNQSGKVEANWTRQQIKRLEDKIRGQESQQLDEMKDRMVESKLETQKLKRQLELMEERLRKLSEQNRRPAPRPAKPAQPAPAPAAPDAASSPAQPADSAPRTYTVQEGDTLQSISLKLFATESRWVEIYELNSDRIERGGTLRHGQTLLLPVK